MLHLPIILSIFVLSAAGQYVDRPCGKDIGNLWLDIVILIDNSNGMTQNGLNQVVHNIGDVFNRTRIGTAHFDARNTRIGIATYSTQGVTVATIDQLSSWKSLMASLSTITISGNDTADLAAGLDWALVVMLNGEDQRFNYHHAMIVYSASYQVLVDSDPPPKVAQLIKDAGIDIITVGMVENGGDTEFLKDLAAIASPNYAFDNLGEGNLVEKVQNALTDANCYCPDDNNWRQYISNYSDPNSQKFGLCIQGNVHLTPWASGKIYCQNLVKNGYLATEFNQMKHDYIFEMAEDDYQQVYAYHIGLTFTNGGWYWQQPKNMAMLPVGNETFWAAGFPVSATTNTGVMNIQNGISLTASWQNVNPYTADHYVICEVASCDTENYCQ